MAYNIISDEFGFWSFPIMIVMYLIGFLVHEFAKVIFANAIAEDSVTKGVPLSHFIEPIGLTLMFVFGVGWSNSAEINALYFKDRKKDTIKIYGLAILTNIIIGILLITFGSKLFLVENIMGLLLFTLGRVVLCVGIINLIPVIPFSGYKVLCELLSPNGKMKLIANEKTIQLLFMLLVIFRIIGAYVEKIVNIITIVVS